MDTGVDSYGGFDKSSRRLGPTGNFFQSRASSQMNKTGDAFGSRMKGFMRDQAVSQKSEMDDGASNQEYAYDNST